MMPRFLISFTLLGVLGQLQIQAQDSVSKIDTLEEVTISASKMSTTRRQTAQQVEIISQVKLERMNAQNSADVLMNTGAVLVQKSQAGGGSPIIRGFESNKVLLQIDGVRINNAIFRGGHLQNVLRIDNAVLEKAEILFGPTSVLYGSDALGGVMHFYTKDPKINDFSGSAFARYSSVNQEKTGHVDFNVGAGKFASLTSFTFSDFGDLRQGEQRRDKYPTFGRRNVYAERRNGVDVAVPNPDPEVQVGTAYKQYDLLQKFRWQPSAKRSHTLNFQYSNTGNVPRYDRLSEVDNAGLPRFARWDYGPETRLFAAYKTEATDLKGFFDRYSFTAAFQQAREGRITRRFGARNVEEKTQQEQVNVWSADFDAIKVMGKHELLMGVEAYFNDVTSRATFLNVNTLAERQADTRYPDGGSSMNSYAAYVQDKYTAGKFIVNLGARYNLVTLDALYLDKTFFPFPFNEAQQRKSALTGNFSAVFLPNDKTKLSFIASSGFRAPNVDDAGKVFETLPNMLIVPNPNIEPEYTYNLELNVSQWLGKVLRVEASAYQTFFLNAIVLDAFKFNGQDSIQYGNGKAKVFANQNKREASIRGINVQAQAFLGQHVVLSGSYNYTLGEILQPKASPLDHIPPVFGRFATQYLKGKFDAEFWLLYNGWKRIEDYLLNAEDNERYATPDGMPAWHTFNLSAGYKFGKIFQLQAAVENIADRNYRVFASGVSGAGRNFRVTGRVRF
jgi:hemoglobin/transferrin/lactoferrin receptor protein